VEILTAALLIAGGLATLTWVVLAKRLTVDLRESILPPQAGLAVVAFAIGIAGIIRAPLRVFHGPLLVVIALVGASYGAVAVGSCLAFPNRTPKSLQVLIGAFCVAAGVLLLLFQFRVIKPT
jgi:hypothetical protein